jgi:hypothetical protein
MTLGCMLSLSFQLDLGFRSENPKFDTAVAPLIEWTKERLRVDLAVRDL